MNDQKMNDQNLAEQFSQQVQTVRNRVVHLQQRAAITSRKPDVLNEALEEFATVVEEMLVAEEELRAQNEELATSRETVEIERQNYLSLFEEAPDAYLVTDTYGTIREANQAASALFSLSHKFLLGKPLVSFVPEEGRQQFRQFLLDIAEDSAEREVRLQPRKGPDVDAAVRVFITKGRDGSPSALRWLVRDISRRRNEEEARYRRLIEEVQDYGIVMLDVAGRVLSWNAGAERIVGYAAAEIVGQPFATLFTPEDRAAGIPEAEMRAAALTGRTEDDRWHLRQNGHRFFANGVLTAMHNEAGGLMGFAKVMRDVTTRRREEERLTADYQRQQRVAQMFEQTILRPVAADAFKGLEVAALYEAAWDESQLGGDYYDAFALDEERVALVLGDVTGKGVVAASRTAEVKFAARTFLHRNADPAQALGDLDRFLCESRRLNEPDAEDLVSLAVAVIDTGSGEVAFALAAAEPPLILHPDGEVTVVQGGNLALGVFCDTQYTAQSLRLSPGDTLILVTDGITEARSRDRRFLDYEGLVSLAQGSVSASSVQGLGEALLSGTKEFSDDSLSDDACLVLARRL